MTDQLEPFMVKKMFDVSSRAGKEIVEADDIRALCQKGVRTSVDPINPEPPVTTIRC